VRHPQGDELGVSSVGLDELPLRLATGPRQIDVVLDLTVSGKAFTQIVRGNLADP